VLQPRQWIEEGLYRQRHVIKERVGAFVLIDEKPCINFCSSDYLGLATSSFLKQKTQEALMQYGVGSTASPMVSGYYGAHEGVEKAFADFLERDAAILLNSGFLANIAVLTTLFSSKDTVAMDQWNHASLIDGLRLSGAQHLRYRHHDISHLKKRLVTHPALTGLVTESVFSMEGDITPLQALQEIAQEKKALFIVDEAHGLGVFGEKGRGILQRAGLSQKEVPLVICPLGKAFASQGAIIAGNAELIEILLQEARPYRYATALPPFLAAASHGALTMVQEEEWRREKLHELIAYFRERAASWGVSCLNSLSPIQSIIVGDNDKAVALSEALLKKGFFVKAIRPPSVPPNTARLRVTLNATHTQKNIEDLLRALANE